MNTRVINNTEITETQLFPDLLTGTDIGTWQADYQLREVEFVHIKHGKPITYNWANSIALTSFGFGLNLLSKGYTNITSINKGEWSALGLGVSISIILYLIGLILPDNRKKVMSNINKHFENAPTRRQAFREGDNNE
jgi:hypothetical protein